jgi:hypothetical protein
MEILNEQFLRFLNNVYYSPFIKRDTFDNFNSYFNNFQEFKNIPFDFDDSLKQYPFYSKDSKIIPSLYIKNNYNFNTKKIMNDYNTVGEVKSQFLDNLIPIINKVNKIPKKIDDILFTNLTQKIIIDDNYFDNYFLELVNIDEQQSFFNLMGDQPHQQFHSSFNNLNLIQIITLYFTFHKLFKNFYNLNTPIIQYFYGLDESIFTKDYISKEFENFIFNQDTLFQKKEINILTRFVLKNIFNLIEPSLNIILESENYIKNVQLPLLSNTFEKFLENNYSENFLNIFSFKSINIFKNILFYHVFNSFITNDINDYILNPFNTEFNFKLSNNKIRSITKNINQYELINYLLPIYTYASHPIKFINISNYFIEQFINDKILTDNIFNDLFQTNNVNNNINDVYKKLFNSDLILSFFNNIDIKQISNDNNLSGIISFYFYKDIIINFIESNEFRDFVISFLNNINDYLYSIKVIQYNYNWFNHIELIKSYFKVFFLKYSSLYKNGVFNNCLFPSLQQHLIIFLNNDTEVNFNATSQTIKNNIEYLKNDSINLNNIYTLTKNIYKGYLNKYLNNIILSHYLIN